MKPHEWFVEHRLDYATRTLDAEEATAFESHLAGCEECRREVARIEDELRMGFEALAHVGAAASFFGSARTP